MQPLATVVIKTNKVGSTVTRTNVTPAEAFVLIADFRDLAGGDPLLSYTLIPEDREDKMLANLQKRHEALKAKYEADSTDTTLIEETRNARLQSTSQAIIRVEKSILEWQGIKAIRSLDAATEKARLESRYQSKLVEHLFPGLFPSVPDSYETAKSAGLRPKLLQNFGGIGNSFTHVANVSV